MKSANFPAKSQRATKLERHSKWVAPAAGLLGVGWGSNQFTPMLLVYRHSLSLSTGILEAMFGIYALGLIPSLLLGGPLSDSFGRRKVVLPAAALSLLASVVLVAGSHSVALLFVGRFLGGASTGAMLAAGTAWLRETSLPPFGMATRIQAVRRVVVAMTLGFAFGPLAAGVLAQWAPASTITPYLPHIVLMVIVFFALMKTPETVRVDARHSVRLSSPAIRDRRFLWVVVPMAPWVFAAPAIAFALLPSVVGAENVANAVVVAAIVTTVTALAGVLIQPLARRFEMRSANNRTAVVGLIMLSAGLDLSSLTADVQNSWLLLPCALVLGSAYGLCLVAGIIEVQRIAHESDVATLTAVYYAVTYLGFAAPFLLAVAAHVADYPILLGIMAALALATACFVARSSAPEPHRV